ncbi:MAG TPA: winged helix-turn-helix domain-containing protein [Oscillatoriaceae cyanobacterium]
MLTAVLNFLQENPDATSFSVCEAFGLSRGMAERVLGMLEDAGHFLLEAPSSGCSSGGCSSGGCSSGGCSTSGPAAAINALADAAKARKAGVL